MLWNVDLCWQSLSAMQTEGRVKFRKIWDFQKQMFFKRLLLYESSARESGWRFTARSKFYISMKIKFSKKSTIFWYFICFWSWILKALLLYESTRSINRVVGLSTAFHLSQFAVLKRLVEQKLQPESNSVARAIYLQCDWCVFDNFQQIFFF